LVDDTLEVREVHTANDGRDPFPVLIGRHKVPKDRYNVESSFPAVVMELSDHEIKQYYTPKDFKIGSTVTIYGRRFLIYDCDNFTKAFFYQNFGITDFDTVEVKDKVKNLPKMVSTGEYYVKMVSTGEYYVKMVSTGEYYVKMVSTGEYYVKMVSTGEYYVKNGKYR
jgi:hypothetical protein